MPDDAESCAASIVTIALNFLQDGGDGFDHDRVDDFQGAMMNDLILAASIAVAASTGNDVASHPAQLRTEAAVLATCEAWSQAEVVADPAYLEWLLLPGYASVGRDGSVHSKAALVTAAQARVTTADAAAAKATFQAYRAAHPYRAHVEIFGNTAIASYLPADSTGNAPVKSSDILVYEGGNWHAVYSQHSDIQ